MSIYDEYAELYKQLNVFSLYHRKRARFLSFLNIFMMLLVFFFLILEIVSKSKFQSILFLIAVLVTVTLNYILVIRNIDSNVHYYSSDNYRFLNENLNIYMNVSKEEVNSSFSKHLREKLTELTYKSDKLVRSEKGVLGNLYNLCCKEVYEDYKPKNKLVGYFILLKVNLFSFKTIKLKIT